MAARVQALTPAELVVLAINGSAAVRVLPAPAAPLAAGVSAAAVPALPAAETVLVAGEFVPGVPAVSPGLDFFIYTFKGLNAYFLGMEWHPVGRVQFRCQDLTAGGFVYSTWTDVGLAFYRVYCVGTMVVGHSYRLAWRLEAVPEVPGWDNDGYHEFSPQLEWVQPDKFSPSVDGEWRFL